MAGRRRDRERFGEILYIVSMYSSERHWEYPSRGDWEALAKLHNKIFPTKAILPGTIADWLTRKLAGTVPAYEFCYFVESGRLRKFKHKEVVTKEETAWIAVRFWDLYKTDGPVAKQILINTAAGRFPPEHAETLVNHLIQAEYLEVMDAPEGPSYAGTLEPSARMHHEKYYLFLLAKHGGTPPSQPAPDMSARS